jgi:hypothetical protein
VYENCAENAASGDALQKTRSQSGDLLYEALAKLPTPFVL